MLDGVEEADASLRARVFRAVGEWRLAQHRERLLDGLEDTVPLCRFEAAYALSLLGDAAGAARLGAGLEQLEGSTLRRAILAWAVAAPSENFAAIFNQLAKVGAWHRELIWALAWRGDPAGLHVLSLRALARGGARLPLGRRAVVRLLGRLSRVSVHARPSTVAARPLRGPRRRR